MWKILISLFGIFNYKIFGWIFSSQVASIFLHFSARPGIHLSLQSATCCSGGSCKCCQSSWGWKIFWSQQYDATICQCPCFGSKPWCCGHELELCQLATGCPVLGDLTEWRLPDPGCCPCWRASTISRHGTARPSCSILQRACVLFSHAAPITAARCTATKSSKEPNAKLVQFITEASTTTIPRAIGICAKC